MLSLILPITFITVIYYTGSLLESLILWCSFAYFDLQILSLIKHVDRQGIVISWMLFEIVMVFFLIKRHVRRRLFISVSKYAIPAIVITVFLALLAVMTVPYNYDSMTYHLPRIMFWIQNHSVEYYYTNDARQLVSSPLTEYLQMETMLLSGTDRLFNLISLSGAAVSMYFIFKLTERISGSELMAGLAAVIYISVPIIEAESISTQVDVFAGMWVAAAAVLIYELGYSESPDKKHIVLLGCALGLCFMTKTNACIPLAVLLIWLLAVRIVKKDKILSLLQYVVLTGMPAFLFAIWSFVRNICLSGDPLAGEYMSKISIGSYNIRYMILNLCKNLVMLGVVSWNPVRSLQLKFVKAASIVLGVDINDPLISFVSGENAFQNNTSMTYQQDYAGAQLLTALIIVCVLIFVILWIRKRKTNGFMAAVIIQFIVMLVFVRWQPWGSRLVVPSLVLMCPFVCSVLSELYGRGKRIFKAVPAMIFLICMFTFVRSYQYNSAPAAKQLSGRYSENELYFYNNNFDSGIAEKYEKLCETAIDTGSKNVGVWCSFDWYEYPTLKKLMPAGVRVENINPDHPVELFYPECIITTGPAYDIADTFKYNGYTYRCTYVVSRDSSYSLFMKEKP